MGSRSLVALLICGSAGAAYAQAEHYEPIRVDGGLSGTYTSASGRGGFGAVVEPKFLIHDHVGVGARFEGAVQFGGTVGSIHRVGAVAQGAEACNGWAYWHVERKNKLTSIDAVRAEIRATMGVAAE